MKKVFIGFLIIFSFCLTVNLWAQQGGEIGEIVYIQGEAELTRNGELLFGGPDFGTPVENYDLVESGADGVVEVSLDPATGFDALIKVEENSSFYFDLSGIENQKKAGIELLRGSVSLKVAKLAGTNQLDVRTSSSVMGVRGTEFVVSTGVGGEILVACSEGRVECLDDKGRVLFAEPGQVVEQIAGERFRNVPVNVSDLATFRSDWIAERIEVFRSNADKAIVFFAKGYLDLKGKFDQAFEELLQKQRIINTWEEQDRTRRPGELMETLRQKKEIIGTLFKLRASAFLFERVYYRLLELETYHDKGLGRTTIKPGLSSEQFFRQFKNDARELKRRMNLVRHVLKMYATRNEGGLPFGENGFSEDGFSDEDSFFGK